MLFNLDLVQRIEIGTGVVSTQASDVQEFLFVSEFQWMFEFNSEHSATIIDVQFISEHLATLVSFYRNAKLTQSVVSKIAIIGYQPSCLRGTLALSPLVSQDRGSNIPLGSRTTAGLLFIHFHWASYPRVRLQISGLSLRDYYSHMPSSGVLPSGASISFIPTGQSIVIQISIQLRFEWPIPQARSNRHAVWFQGVTLQRRETHRHHPLICFGTRAINNTPHPRCTKAPKTGGSTSRPGKMHLCYCCCGCAHVRHCDDGCAVYYSFRSVIFSSVRNQVELTGVNLLVIRSSSQTHPKNPMPLATPATSQQPVGLYILFYYDECLICWRLLELPSPRLHSSLIIVFTKQLFRGCVHCIYCTCTVHLTLDTSLATILTRTVTVR